MNEALRPLDGDLTAAGKLGTLLECPKHDDALRSGVAMQQLVRDGLAGRRTLDDGDTLAPARLRYPPTKPK